MYMAADEFPLPYEYRFFELDGLQSTLPDDLDERTIVFLDCGNIDRNPVGAFKREEAHILNIDHHHDNTRFGTVNHVVEDASCTAEIVWDLMRALGVEPAMEIAEALYVGLVTDTGKFMYENTGVRAHVMAAELIDAGRRRPRHLPPPVRGHALRQARAAGARPGPRPALRRGPPDLHPPDPRRLPPLGRRGQLLGGHHRPPAIGRGHEGRRPRARAARRQPRATQGLAARHRRPASTSRSSRAPAAGAGTARRRASPPRCPKRTSSASCANRSPRSCSGRSRPRRQAPGEDLARPHARHAAAAGRAQGRPRGHAGPVRHRTAARPRRPRAARAALPHGAAQAVRHRRAAGRDLDHRRPRGRDHAHRAHPAARRGAAHRAHRPAPADLLGRPRAGPQGLRARARRRGSSRCPSARSTSTASSSSGAGRTAPSSSSSARPGPTCARSSPSWATATARSCGARASGPSTSQDADPQRVLPLEQALAFLPRVEVDADEAWRAGHGQTIAGEAEGEHVLLADADGPVAIAEPREDGLLKPVVGFRG